MVTVEKRGGVNGEESATFYGLSEDTKPTLANSGTEIPNGSAFLEIDTKQVYFYNPDIYLVPKSTTQTHNVYDEYIYVSSAWELIGTTQVDLSNYYTKTQTNTLLNAKQPTTLATSVTIGTTTYTTVESALQELANRVTSSCYITTS